MEGQSTSGGQQAVLEESVDEAQSSSTSLRNDGNGCPADTEEGEKKEDSVLEEEGKTVEEVDNEDDLLKTDGESAAEEDADMEEDMMGSQDDASPDEEPRQTNPVEEVGNEVDLLKTDEEVAVEEDAVMEDTMGSQDGASVDKEPRQTNPVEEVGNKDDLLKTDEEAAAEQDAVMEKDTMGSQDGASVDEEPRQTNPAEETSEMSGGEWLEDLQDETSTAGNQDSCGQPDAYTEPESTYEGFREEAPETGEAPAGMTSRNQGSDEGEWMECDTANDSAIDSVQAQQGEEDVEEEEERQPAEHSQDDDVIGNRPFGSDGLHSDEPITEPITEPMNSELVDKQPLSETAEDFQELGNLPAAAVTTVSEIESVQDQTAHEGAHSSVEDSQGSIVVQEGTSETDGTTFSAGVPYSNNIKKAQEVLDSLETQERNVGGSQNTLPEGVEYMHTEECGSDSEYFVPQIQEVVSLGNLPMDESNSGDVDISCNYGFENSEMDTGGPEIIAVEGSDLQNSTDVAEGMETSTCSITDEQNLETPVLQQGGERGDAVSVHLQSACISDNDPKAPMQDVAAEPIIISVREVETVDALTAQSNVGASDSGVERAAGTEETHGELVGNSGITPELTAPAEYSSSTSYDAAMSQTGDAPSDPSARDSAAVDPSAAESLVSSIQSNDLAIKREMLDDVLGDSSGTDTPRPTSSHTDTPHPDHEVDVKPNLEELDKVVQQAGSKDSPVDGPEAVAMQGKQAESRRNKGSSITSIVGRLFKTKQEEEARKKMECSPEESHDQPGSDQIANVPIKISGVKSLAPTNLASARQQRQEKRQASMDFVISNVTSLATGVEKCSKCEKEIKPDETSYMWQSEKFCCFPCLEEKREVSSKTITCDSCSAVIHPRARHAFFRKGERELREFCSADCMEKSEKSPKMCPGCGKDVANQANSILAQVGPEGEFFEFCKQECVNSYEESIVNDENKEPEISFVKRFSKACCSECGLIEMVRYEFCYREKTRAYCSEACFDAFRMKHNIKIRRCAECNCMCFSDTSNGLVVATGKQTRYFCTQKCKTAGLKPCSNCSVLQPWKDMLRREPNSWEFLCSQSCLDQHKKKKDIPPMQPLQPVTQVSSNTNSSRPRSPPNLRSRTAPTASSTDTSTPQQQMSQLQSQGKKVQCDHCGKQQKPLYHLTMSDHTLRNFCCYNCVISYQGKFNVPPVTLPQETLLLRCHQCQRGFNSRPFVLDYEDKTSLFCGKKCIEDFKRTKCVSMICDQCHQDKILYEETYFCGEARSFCSEGCKLLFKQEIVEKLGLQCIVCDYCAQMCQQSSQERFDGNLCHFCSPACKEKYGLWFFKAAKCDGCKKMGTDLSESFKWRGEMKRVCNQQCLLLFYTQQDTPNVSTQLPEPIPTSTADHATPTIAKVMSYTPVEKLGPARTYITEPKKPSSDKQTQITTNTVYIKPPPPPPSSLPPGPKMVRNKITSCKPINITKATMCRPFVKDMCVGTDFPKVPAMVPIPVPIFVPVPMQMYKMPVPHPVCVPVPVPTPVFIPVAARDCDRLMSTLEQIKARVPSDPLEAELFMMAAAAAGESESGPDSREDDIGRDSHRGSSRDPPKMSLVDQAVKECGLLDEVMDDVGVDELLASLSSPDVADDILLLDDDDDESQEERENRRLEEELTSKLRNLGDIPESEGVPPPPLATPRIKRIILKKKRRKRGVKRSKRPREVKGGGPQQASQDSSLPLRRSSRSTKKTKYFSAGEESQEEVDEEEEYQPEESSSDEEIVEMEDEVSQEDAPPPKPVGPPPIDESWVTAGQAAYSLFVHRHNKGVKTPAMRLQASILECPTDMLHRGLIMFLRHARRPDADEPYPPETMFLLCLSIQHLVTNSGRMENFFVGPNFEQFRLCLHQTLASWAPRLHPQSGLLLNSRITEEMMWSAQQLGAHSPQVLLSTIFFFNCKNLAMNTVQEHSEVAFFRMQKHVKKTGPGRERAHVIRYFPPKKKPDEDSSEAPGTSRRKKEQVLERLDQSENTENVLRCPVKLYEFYLSKCPEAVKMRNQVLYLLPEHSCVPDSPVWYSATKLPDEEMAHMLHRYAMIHEVQTAWRLKEKLAKEKDAAPPPSSSSHQSPGATEESATPIETTVPGQESGTQI